MAKVYGQPDNNPDTRGAAQYGVGTNREPSASSSQNSPSTREVQLFHKNADTDTRTEAIHHTLGRGPTQASPGDHTHDGSDSRKILEGYVLTGSKSSPATVMPSIIAALVRLGAKDSTTA